jgi:hypothetical protein
VKLERAIHEPSELLEFYEEGLATLGALCERTWHDRLEVIAEGRAAKLWNPDGAMHEVELQFAPADATSARDASREVFPGCPLTFQLADALRPSPLPLERFILPDASPPRPPDPAVAEKIWRTQFSDSRRWQLEPPWKPDVHFSLLAIVRCEIQAIDQHWSLHRLSISLTDGESDDALARELGFHQTAPPPDSGIRWPEPNPSRWRDLLQSVIEQELVGDTNRVRNRQQDRLRHELERIDDYFENYEHELSARAKRSASKNSQLKIADRLAAARAEHARRRTDQLARHEIGIHPHLDALMLIGEKAWSASLQVERAHRTETVQALFVPRLRQWKTG